MSMAPMQKDDGFVVSLTKTYKATPATILGFFRDNTIFSLTGANEIESNFECGGLFNLSFTGRGVIYGQFKLISYHQLALEWNVSGFGRPHEKDTIVEISLTRDHEKCILQLIHKNIPSPDSAYAKEQAWTSIFDDLEFTVNQSVDNE